MRLLRPGFLLTGGIRKENTYSEGFGIRTDVQALPRAKRHITKTLSSGVGCVTRCQNVVTLRSDMQVTLLWDSSSNKCEIAISEPYLSVRSICSRSDFIRSGFAASG